MYIVHFQREDINTTCWEACTTG